MKTLLFVLSLLVSACSTPAPEPSKFETQVTSWKNQDINEVIETWGAPTKVFKAPNGNTLYEYDRGGGGGLAMNVGGNLMMVDDSSKTTFTLDKNNKIIHCLRNRHTFY